MNDNTVKQPRCLDDLPELCAMSDLEAILSVSRATAYRMAQRGEIPCLRLGKRFIFSREHLKHWIEQKMTGEVRGNGEGSLYQDGKGSWIFQYSEDGKRKTNRFQKKADAKIFIDSMNSSVAVNSVPLSVFQPSLEEITVEKWMRTWLETYARPAVKLSTYASYEQYIRGHIVPQIGNLSMSTLKPVDMQNFFNDRAVRGHQEEGKGLSPKTLTNLRNMMHLAFEQAVREGYLARNIIEDVRLPKMTKQEMGVLDRKEQERLILSAQFAPEPSAFGVIFAMFTGLRLGEICALKWENVDMEKRLVCVQATRNRLPNFDDSIQASTSVVTHESPKTENSRRAVFLMPGCIKTW